LVRDTAGYHVPLGGGGLARPLGRQVQQPSEPRVLSPQRRHLGLGRGELRVHHRPVLKPYTSGRSLALKVQKQVGLDPALNIVVLGRDGSVQLTDTAAAFLSPGDPGDPAAQGRDRPSWRAIADFDRPWPRS
jgi:hypothetical protein